VIDEAVVAVRAYNIYNKVTIFLKQ